MSLSTLLLDIKIYISLLDPDTYYHLYSYDPEFSQYAKTHSAIKQYKLQFNTPITNKYGTQMYMLFNKLHREDDLPAAIYLDGSCSYFYNGRLHRDSDLPAITYQSRLEYYKHGKLHRDDDENGTPKPAIIWSDGTEVYFKNGNQFQPT